MSLGLLGRINDFRKSNKKIDDIVTTEMMHPYGLAPLDYINGYTVTTYDEFDQPVMQTDLIGGVSGSLTTVIGNTGTGKSAIGAQMSAAPIYRFKLNTAVNHYDIEQASSLQRIMMGLKIPPSILKHTYQITRDRGAEDIVDHFIDHCMTKINNRKEFTYNTGVYDVFGNEIIEMYPSSALLDSFALFKSKKLDLGEKSVDDVTNNMVGAQAAKFNKGVLIQMLGYAKKANVSLFSINHIDQNVNTSFLPKPSQQMYLGQDEHMPGGQASLFLANNILKLKYMKKYDISKPDTMEYGIPGFIVEARYLKSRTNASNIPVRLIFDQRVGSFSKTLTLLHFAIENSVLQGSATSMYIPGLESVKFRKKNFMDVAAKSPEILMALYEACMPNLRALLSNDTRGLARSESDSDRFDAYTLAIEESIRDAEFYKKNNFDKLGWVL